MSQLLCVLLVMPNGEVFFFLGGGAKNPINQHTVFRET